MRRLSKPRLQLRLALALTLVSIGTAGADARSTSAAAEFRARLPEDEVIYFVMPDRFENGDASNDRGGLSGGRLRTGYDPASKGFFHGGDLKGLTSRLEYIQGL